MQFFDDEALAAGACAADVLAQCEAGDHRAGGQRQQLVGQRLSGSVIECVGLGLPLQQQGGRGGVGQDQVCPAAEPAHPVDESRGHCGVGLAVVPHHRVHHLAGSRPEIERLFGQRHLLLAA